MLLKTRICSAIEKAPALGSHDEVVAILCGVIPDLAVDQLHAVLVRPDGSVRIALGPDDLMEAREGHPGGFGTARVDQRVPDVGVGQRLHTLPA